MPDLCGQAFLFLLFLFAGLVWLFRKFDSQNAIRDAAKEKATTKILDWIKKK